MNSELMRRAAITLGALLVYRIGIHLPLPGIDPAAWELLFRSQEGGILSFANIFAGGGLKRMAILALNLVPYLTAAPLVQLFVLFWPRLRAISEHGDRARRKIQLCTLGLTLLLAAFQAYGIAVGLEGVGHVVSNPGLFFRITTVVTLTGGTFFLVWLSEFITVRGIGNGLALILFAGIVAEGPAAVVGTFQLYRQGYISDSVIFGLGPLMVVLVASIVFVELARRYVPVEYQARQVGDRMVEKGMSTLAFKLNSAGAIALVFAGQLLSVLIVLGFVVQWLLIGRQDPEWLSSLGLFAAGRPGHMIYLAIAVVLISLLYVALLIDPDQVAEKLKRYGSVVPGIEPGQATAVYIDSILTRTAILGCAYLAAVVVVPEALITYAQLPFYFGGASALILVCTVLDLQAQVRGYNFITISRERQR
jgi:preprotein translocase subunit SecY